ncbi:hypothetical protein GCM10011326_41270 [Salipiger profundus]|nr:hypothetical protein GCM10011326_41270 [Salipiger profundus]
MALPVQRRERALRPRATIDAGERPFSHPERHSHRYAPVDRDETTAPRKDGAAEADDARLDAREAGSASTGMTRPQESENAISLQHARERKRKPSAVTDT